MTARRPSVVRRRALSGGLLPGLLTVCLLVGCAPQAPDHSSWRDQAHLSLQDVGSNVSTMTLLVQLVRDGKMFGKYQQIVALNSETNAGRTASHFSAEQPESIDDDTYTRVTTVLSDADDLLSETRIALVRRDSAEYPKLAHELAAMTRRLTSVESKVTAVDPS